MDCGLDGRVALVTGAASGIGLASARALAREGCRLVAADLDPAPAQAMLAGAAAEGRLHLLEVDVADPQAARGAVAATVERFGRLDVLLTAAGVYETNALEQLSDAEWERVVTINLRGTFACARAAIPAMAANRWGRVITVASMAAQTGGMAAGAAYVASKAGVMGLTRSLAHAAGPHGVTVNCVAPGVIDTPMTKRLAAGWADVAARTPLRRIGTVEDVSGVVLMLASEAAGFVTGTHVNVNGGMVMD
jgi:3-oxoacyl-[acyl-carrier protein] reductase